MCLTSGFFTLLLLYLILLIMFTVTRKHVTYKGIFYAFTAFLSCFMGYLVYMFFLIVLDYANSDLNFVLNAVNWLGLDISISLKLDALSYLFILLVTVIGCSTNFYVLNYMKYEAQEDIFALLIN